MRYIESDDAVEQADDLFGRWLAHHESGGAATPSGRTTTAVPTKSPSENTALRRRVAGQPLIQPPSNFGASRRSSAASPAQDAEPGEPDRMTPHGFEPIIVRSARKRSEPKEPHKPEKARLLGRLRGGRTPQTPAAPQARATEPRRPAELPSLPFWRKLRRAAVEPAPEPAPATALSVAAVAVPDPAPEPVAAALPDPDPAPARPESASAALAMLYAETAHDVEPEIDLERDLEPVARPEPQPDPEPTPQPAAREETKAPRTRRRPARKTAPRKQDPARALIATARGTKTRTRPTPVTEPSPAAAPALALVTSVTAAEPWGAAETSTPKLATYAPPAPTAPQMPAVYRFEPLKSSRRVLTALLLIGLAATGWLAWAAYQTRDEITMGITAIVGLVTLVVWGIRAGANPIRLTIRNGQLEVVKQGTRFVFDLTSTYTPIEVTGTPGRKSWKVQFMRRGEAPFVVDATMVNPQEFMRVLGFFRPERPD